MHYPLVFIVSLIFFVGFLVSNPSNCGLIPDGGFSVTTNRTLEPESYYAFSVNATQDVDFEDYYYLNKGGVGGGQDGQVVSSRVAQGLVEVENGKYEVLNWKVIGLMFAIFTLLLVTMLAALRAGRRRDHKLLATLDRNIRTNRGLDR